MGNVRRRGSAVDDVSSGLRVEDGSDAEIDPGFSAGGGGAQIRGVGRGADGQVRIGQVEAVQNPEIRAGHDAASIGRHAEIVDVVLHEMNRALRQRKPRARRRDQIDRDFVKVRVAQAERNVEIVEREVRIGDGDGGLEDRELDDVARSLSEGHIE